MKRLSSSSTLFALLPILLFVSFAAAQTSGDSSDLEAEKTRQRPNVVFILADDLGWRDLSCQGSTFYESPHIDRICNEGMRFNFAYSACQVCSPSRAAIMTGCHPARLKITDYIGAPSGTDWKRNTKLLPAFYERNLPHDHTTIAEAFKADGYKTFFAGKWHLGSKGSFPEDHGFDVNVGGHFAGTPPGGYFVPYNNPMMTDGPAGECLPERLGAETAKFIEQNKDEPFMAFLSFYSVHGPIQSTEKLWKKYRAKAVADPDLQKVENRFLIDRTMPVRQVQDHPLYGGMVESMDNGVGTVLDALDRLGLAENTIVIFTSDNGGVSSGDGYATSNLPLRGGKGRQWEGGVRVPLFVRWPGQIAKASSTDVPAIGMDYFPTLLDLCDVETNAFDGPEEAEQQQDGISLKKVLLNDSTVDLETLNSRMLLWHYPHYGNQGGEPSSMVRYGDWKLIQYLEDDRFEFYNLAEDPSEQTDLGQSNHKDHIELIKLLNGIMEIDLFTMSAENPAKNPSFDAEKYAQWQTNQKEKRLPSMERNHARFLNEDFRPTDGWWEQRE